MACLFNSGGINVSGLYEAASACSSNSKVVPWLRCSVSSLRNDGSKGKGMPLLTAEFMGRQVVVSNVKEAQNQKFVSPARLSVSASGCVGRAMRWWDKSIKPNMVEINSARELVSALLHAGDALVVVDFYSPGCGGCRSLHPKVAQLAELYPEATFLKVNYEELTTMCQSLHIRVLPFFRFYRGSEGRVCSFSCTNATIKKFKDALAKHGTERPGIGSPAKGLDESEILRLASCGEISMDDFPTPGKENTLDSLVASTMGNISEAISGMALKEEFPPLLNV